MTNVSTRSRWRGQALAEFALVIPIFLVMLFAIVDLGRVVWASNAVAHGAREAARFAIVHGGSKITACPVGPRGPEAIVPRPSSSCPYPSDSTQAIKDVAIAHAIAGGAPVTVTVCYGQGCSGDTHAPGADNRRLTPVTVNVTGSIGLLTGTFVGMGPYTLSSTSTMLVNH